MKIENDKNIIYKTNKFIEDIALSFDEQILAGTTGDLLFIVDLKTDKLYLKRKLKADFRKLKICTLTKPDDCLLITDHIL